MSDLYQSLSHSKWDCKYHIVFVPKRRRKAVFGKLRRHDCGGGFVLPGESSTQRGRGRSRAQIARRQCFADVWAANLQAG